MILQSNRGQVTMQNEADEAVFFVEPTWSLENRSSMNMNPVKSLFNSPCFSLKNSHQLFQPAWQINACINLVKVGDRKSSKCQGNVHFYTYSDTVREPGRSSVAVESFVWGRFTSWTVATNGVRLEVIVTIVSKLVYFTYLRDVSNPLI